MIYSLTILTLALAGVALAIWLVPTIGMGSNPNDMRFGVYEGMQLVGKVDKWGNEHYLVEDANGKKLFDIPLRNCIIDVRFRNGQLRFRENGTMREGYIDKVGIVVFDKGKDIKPERANGIKQERTGNIAQQRAGNMPQQSAGAIKQEHAGTIPQQLNGATMAKSHPFYKEAAKILKGKLDENDKKRRQTILNYCEHLRMAYTTKDVDFIRQVFSENALIIVGNVVKARPGNAARMMGGRQVEYNLRTKSEYIARLQKAFAANKSINVKFGNFRIMRHPSADGIYGVSMRQAYSSDIYSDDGYLFLLWDFRNPEMPLIHVRTWQPAETIGQEGEVMGITDFNLE